MDIVATKYPADAIARADGYSERYAGQLFRRRQIQRR